MKKYKFFTAGLRRAIKKDMDEAISTSQDGSFDIIIRKYYCEGRITKQLFMRLQGDAALRDRVNEK